METEPVHPIEAYVALTVPSFDLFMGRVSRAIERACDLAVRAGVDETEVSRQRWLARDAARAGHHGTHWEYQDLRTRLLGSLDANFRLPR